MNKKRNIFAKISNIFFICILLFSSYKIYEKMRDYRKDENTYKEIQALAPTNNAEVQTLSPTKDKEVQTLTPNNENKISKYEKLKSMNSDYQFWIKIDSTNIDYPVVKGKDNKYYLTHDFNKSESISGSVFMDYRNDFSQDKNTILYAHYMKNKTMFGEIINFKKEDFFLSNNKITVTLDNKEYIYQPFSVYVVDADYDYLITKFESDEDYLNYINKAKNKSMYKTNIEVSSDDKIITLSTCSYEFKDARTVVHGKLLEKN